MKLSDFKYPLPDEFIAQYPVEKRDESRLLVVNRENDNISHHTFRDLPEFLRKGDCLVINETKVFPARLMGTKEKTDAQVEIFLLRELESSLWEVLVKPARKVRVGNRLSLTDDLYCDVIDNTVSGGRVVRFNYNGNFFSIVQKLGRSPLPPYIKREPEDLDKERYQTIFAKVRGAVAAPTAGLHFTEELVKTSKSRGVRVVPIVLHVGLGSFRPVMVEDLSRHKMDSEYYEVYEESARIINETKSNGGKVIAVGTTSVRALETAVTSDNMVKTENGWTDKFIYPPYSFKIVDALITNFHLPCSTLLMLASAFAGQELITAAYREAVNEKYRFYSYGDAMLIL
ncbi:MAG: tRNA preQ1(34) S-adenosylmethionine ribosyltransferase-isomerase QueA [bacterium]